MSRSTAAVDAESTDGTEDTCTLCGLPTSTSPHTAPEVNGAFCCRGCLEIARSLDEVESASSSDPTDPHDRLDTGPAVTDTNGDTAFLSVDGMHCATCETFLESVATDHEGVLAAEASYPTELVKVAYDPDRLNVDDLPPLVEGLGYRARLADDTEEEAVETDASTTRMEDDILPRLLLGGFFGMMVMAWYLLFLYPVYLGVPQQYLLFDVSGSAGRFLLANVWVMASVVLGYTGYPLLRGAYVSLRARQPNMDLLVTLAAVTAYLFSTLSLLLGRVEVYFDVTVVIVLAITVGEYYERRIRRSATARLGDITTQHTDTARRRTDQSAGDSNPAVEEVPVDALQPGDLVVVRTGDRIPVDGEVHEGEAAVDNSLLTGESLPVRVEPGDEVIGGALVTDGRLVVTVGSGETNTRERLARLLWSVQSATPGMQRIADRVAAAFVPLVFVLALATFGYQLVLGSGLTTALLVGLSVLVVSCPCALGIATPLAVATGIRRALDRGIIVASTAVFELVPDVDVVAFDKTGTLTTGDMQVQAVTAAEAVDCDKMLHRAAVLEQYADHPVATAIVDHATTVLDEKLESAVTDFERYPGRGISGIVETESGSATVRIGTVELFDKWDVPPELARQYRQASEAGAVPSYVGWDQKVKGVVVAGDDPRSGWDDALASLGASGCEIVVVTGDDAAAAERYRNHDAVSEVFAEVRPEAKAEVVDRLRQRGTVVMVGDGSNDAPALAAADIGVAMASGTDLAVDAADLIVTNDDLVTVPEAFGLLSATRRRIRQNLAWGFGYNAVALPLAIVGLLNPLFAAVAMAASSVLVVANSVRTLE